MDTQHRSRANKNMNNWYTENFLFMRYNQKDLLIKYSSTEELTPRAFKKGDTPRTSLFLHSYKDMFWGFFCRWVVCEWCFFARLERLVGSGRLSATSKITSAVWCCYSQKLELLDVCFPSFSCVTFIHSSPCHGVPYQHKVVLWHTYCIIISYSALRLQIRATFNFKCKISFSWG